MKRSSEEEHYDAYVGRVSRGVGIGSFGQGLGRALAYVTQIVLARMYGPAQLGFYALGVAIVGFANILADFGLHNPVVRRVARHHAEGDDSRIRGTILLALAVSFALSLALSVGMFAGAGFLADTVFDKPAMQPMFRVFSLSVPFLALMSMALFATQGFQTVKYYSLVQLILQPLINLMLVVIFYLLGARILGAVGAYAVSMAVGAVLALYYLRRMFPQLLHPDTPPVFESRSVLGESGPVFVAITAEYVNVWTGVAVLGILSTGEQVGIYNAAARTALIAGVVYMVFVQIFTPIISNLYGSGRLRELGYLYADVSRWMFAGGLLAFWGTVLFSKDILALFGPEFVAGSTVMIVGAAGQLFALSIGATNRVLLMTGRQSTYMLAMIAAAVTGIVASFALVPSFGILGAAFSDAGTTVLANVITLIALRRALGLWPFSRGYIKPFIAGILAAAVVVLARLVLPMPLGAPALLVLSPLFLLGFAATMLILGLSPSDRQFLKAMWIALPHPGRR